MYFFTMHLVFLTMHFLVCFQSSFNCTLTLERRLWQGNLTGNSPIPTYYLWLTGLSVCTGHRQVCQPVVSFIWKLFRKSNVQILKKSFTFQTLQIGYQFSNRLWKKEGNMGVLRERVWRCQWGGSRSQVCGMRGGGVVLALVVLHTSGETAHTSGETLQTIGEKSQTSGETGVLQTSGETRHRRAGGETSEGEC